MANIFSTPYLGGDSGSAPFSMGSIGSGLGGVLGLAGGIFSAISGSQDASKIGDIQKQEISTEMRMNDLRQQAMRVAYEKSSRENTRRAQMARSMSLSTASNQLGGGAQGSSVLGGAYGGISGQSNENQLNLTTNFTLGNEAFARTADLDREKIAMAEAQAKMQKDQAFGKMLGGIGGSLGDIFKMGGSAGGMLSSLLPLLAA